MIVAAEGTRPDAGLTAGFSVSSSSLGISVERPGRCAGTAGNSATLANSTADVGSYAPLASSSVIIVSVIKRVTPGVVPVVVVSYGSVMPIRSPMMPAPSVTSEVADSEAWPE
jgi:hypothetical protein